MEGKAKKKRSTIDQSDLGSSFDLDSNKGKKKEPKERGEKHATDKMLKSNETLGENSTVEAADKQSCSIEGNITLMCNEEEKSQENKRKKTKERKGVEVTNSSIAGNQEVQFLDVNQESKVKKRKKNDYSLNGMQELSFSKPSKRRKMTENNEIKGNKGEDDDQGKEMKKKKLGEESQHGEYNEFKNIKDKDDDQLKKMKKKQKLSKESKKGKMTEDNELKDNEGEDDDQGKKMMKKKKSGEERQHEEYNGLKGIKNKDDDQHKKKMKKKRKLNKESKKGKMTEDNEIKGNEGEDDDQGKRMKKKKKLDEESQHEQYNEFKNIEDKDDDQHKKKKLSNERKSKEYNEFKSNEGEDDDRHKNMKKKKLCEQSKSKENGEFNSNEGDSPLARVESGDRNAGFIDTEVDDQSKKKKAEAETAESTNPGSSKPKRVTFSDKVDVCCDGLVRGKRFTPKEDEKIKLAVYDYIESHGLGDEGLDMILHCQSHSEVKDCWKEIGAALPERPMYSVYYRAHILFERDEKRKWTPEELEFLRKVQEQHGSDWKSVAEALGKHRFHVKDAWRRIKLTNTNKGRWTQEEYQKLFDLVNLDLRARASDGYRKSKHGMLRDNIGWEAIGDKLATRSSSRCCKKWYEQLTSPMVASGAWSDTDDYRLISALFTLDPCTMAEVDWDNLLEHRPGDVCRKRWNQMVQFIGQHGGKPFGEQVEILAKRFCPDLLEVREAFDEKPVRC